jgi:hypothetical protein
MESAKLVVDRVGDTRAEIEDGIFESEEMLEYRLNTLDDSAKALLKDMKDVPKAQREYEY